MNLASNRPSGGRAGLLAHAVAWSILIGASAAPGVAQQRTVRLISPAFALITDGSVDDARQLLTELEVFRQTVSRFLGLPHEHRTKVNVYLWADPEEFEQFRPPSVSPNKPLGGYHISDGFTHALVVRRQPDPQATRPSLFHEYTHLLTNRLLRRVPLWINEGLAELFSTFRVAGAQFTFGGPNEPAIQTLTSDGTFPGRMLLEVHHDSAAYEEPAEVPRFYASAWLLAQTLTISQNGFNASVVRDYIAQSGLTTNRTEAFQRAFGITPEQADARMQRQLDAGAFPHVTQRFGGAGISSSMQQWLQPAETMLQEGMLARLIGQNTRAEGLLRDARTAMPGDSRPAEQLGFLLDRLDRPDEALELVETALKLGSVSCQTHYLAARLRWNRLVDARARGPSADQERREVLRLIERAVRLDPWQADCQALHAFVLLHIDPANPKAAEAAARRALQLDPYLDAARLTLAQALLARGQRGAARRATLALLGSPLTPELRPQVDHLATQLGLSHGNAGQEALPGR